MSQCLVFCAGWYQPIKQLDFLKEAWHLTDFYTVDIDPAAGADLTSDLTDPLFLASIPPGRFQYIAFLNCSAEGTLFLKRSDGSNVLAVDLLRIFISKVPVGGSLIIDNLLGVVPFLATYFKLPTRGLRRVELLAQTSGYIEDATLRLLDGAEIDPLFVEITNWLAAQLPGTEVELVLIPGKKLPVVEIMRLG